MHDHQTDFVKNAVEQQGIIVEPVEKPSSPSAYQESHNDQVETVHTDTAHTKPQDEKPMLEGTTHSPHTIVLDSSESEEHADVNTDDQQESMLPLHYNIPSTSAIKDTVMSRFLESKYEQHDQKLSKVQDDIISLKASSYASQENLTYMRQYMELLEHCLEDLHIKDSDVYRENKMDIKFVLSLVDSLKQYYDSYRDHVDTMPLSNMPPSATLRESPPEFPPRIHEQQTQGEHQTHMEKTNQVEPQHSQGSP